MFLNRLNSEMVQTILTPLPGTVAGAHRSVSPFPLSEWACARVARRDASHTRRHQDPIARTTGVGSRHPIAALPPPRPIPSSMCPHAKPLPNSFPTGALPLEKKPPVPRGKVSPHSPPSSL
jgi:hypothetical protein